MDSKSVANALNRKLEKIALTAVDFNLTGYVKYTYPAPMDVNGWDSALSLVREYWIEKGYSCLNHVIEVKKGFNVYLILD
jgi:hypothetical protein